MAPWKINASLVIAYLLTGIGWSRFIVFDDAGRWSLVCLAVGICLYVIILFMKRPDGNPVLKKGRLWVPFYFQ